MAGSWFIVNACMANTPASTASNIRTRTSPDTVTTPGFFIVPTVATPWQLSAAQTSADSATTRDGCTAADGG